jgi:hypothetical protein
MPALQHTADEGPATRARSATGATAGGAELDAKPFIGDLPWGAAWRAAGFTMRQHRGCSVDNTRASRDFYRRVRTLLKKR